MQVLVQSMFGIYSGETSKLFDVALGIYRACSKLFDVGWL